MSSRLFHLLFGRHRDDSTAREGPSRTRGYRTFLGLINSSGSHLRHSCGKHYFCSCDISSTTLLVSQTRRVGKYADKRTVSCEGSEDGVVAYLEVLPCQLPKGIS